MSIPIASVTAFRRWTRRQTPDELERALLELRERIMQVAHDAPDSCSRTVNEVILPVLAEGGEPLVPVSVAYSLLAARFARSADSMYRAAISTATARGLGVLAARGMTEWAHWCITADQPDRAEECLRDAQRRFCELGLREEADELYLSRAQIACRVLPPSGAARRIASWLNHAEAPSVLARLELELAQCRMREGDAVAADDYLLASIERLRTTADQFGRHVALVYRGRWFWHLGAYARASSLLDRARRWFAENGYALQEDVAAANLASVCVAANQRLSDAAASLGELRDRTGKSDPLLWWQLTINLAAACEKRGQFTAAAKLYQELAVAKCVRSWETKLAGLNFAHLRLRAGWNEGLDADLEAALRDPVVRGDLFLCFLANGNMGDRHGQRGDWRAASACYDVALKCVEDTRISLPWEFLRRQLREARLHVMDRLESSLLEQGRWADAWSIADRRQAQSFCDFLLGPYPRLEQGSYHRYVRVRRALTRAYEATQRAEDAGGLESVQETTEIDRLECLADQVIGEGRRRYTSPTDEPQWQQWAWLRSADNALIQFQCTERGWAAYLIRDGRVMYQPIAPSEPFETLASSAVSWWHDNRRIVTGSPSIERWQADTDRWYRILLAPWADDLDGVSQLMVVPHGALSLLPWAGLYDATRSAYFGDRFAGGLAVLPGSRVGQMLAERRIARTAPLTLVARPGADLPYTDLEACWVAEQLGATLLENEHVTCDALQQLLPHCRWFHYSGHGHFNHERPMAAHLKLARGQRWTAWDMMTRPLPATIVVLAACEVGTTREVEAGEWHGLLRGLFAAGAQAIVAALWETLDFGSMPLMRNFYRIVESERNLAAALHRARLQVRDLAAWAFTTHALRDRISEVIPWKCALDPSQSPLRTLDFAGTLSDNLGLLRAGMEWWRRSAVGKHASNAQCWQAMWTLLSELSLLGHPRHWSAYQVYGITATRSATH